MIVRGGENVYPREIEDVLHRHPEVIDVHVVGVPDPAYGETVVAVVSKRPGSPVTGEELRDYCRGLLAHFKISGASYSARISRLPRAARSARLSYAPSSWTTRADDSARHGQGRIVTSMYTAWKVYLGGGAWQNA